jgi:iron complex transport system substrate-binding protein
VHSRNDSKLRIVSLAPSATSIVCAIGAKKSLVAVTKWCPQVAPVNGLPQLGDCWHMDGISQILALRPSLIIGSVPYKQETVAKLLEQPVSFLAMNPRSLAGIYADIRLLAGILGKQSAGNRLIRSMQREFARISRRPKPRRRVRVYCEAWPNPRISSPPWVAELVEICGGQMVVPAGAKVSDEQVADADPELIVLAWAATAEKSDPAQTYKIAAWKNTAALRNRRVHVIRDELLNTPGPPLVQGAAELYKILQTPVTRRKNR